MVLHRVRARSGAELRLLVHGLPRGAEGSGGRGSGGIPEDPSHRGVPEALVRDTRHLPRADRLVHPGPEDPNGGRGQQCRPLRDGLLLPHRDADDRHYLNVGRIATVAGVLLSIATAYLALSFTTIMNYVQVLHGMFLAPLFGTFL